MIETCGLIYIKSKLAQSIYLKSHTQTYYNLQGLYTEIGLGRLQNSPLSLLGCHTYIIYLYKLLFYT